MSNFYAVLIKKAFFLKTFLTVFLWTTICVVMHASANNPNKNHDDPDSKAVNDYSEFCQKNHRERDQLIQTDPTIKLGHQIHTLESATCFDPDENLKFVATIAAQDVLGPNAPWYQEISAEFKNQVKEVCKTITNDEANRAYSHCVESRYKQLIGPYNDKFTKESAVYVSKRNNIADNLITQCHDSLNLKRKLLPKDIRFPIALHNLTSRSIPNWLLEEKIMNNDKWLENVRNMTYGDMMHDVLGDDCPGEMVYWITYDMPGLHN